MKTRHLIIPIALSIIFAACEEEEEQAATESWKLIEQLMDPGDGSGTFTAVVSDKTIQFLPDSTITCTGNLCQMGIESGNGSTGTNTETTHTITPDSCGFSGFPISYEMEGANLILNYPCFEPCKEKYELVE